MKKAMIAVMVVTTLMVLLNLAMLGGQSGTTGVAHAEDIPSPTPTPTPCCICEESF